jgi:hypothetical protein
MSQTLVYEWLHAKRLQSQAWYTAKQIKLGLSKQGHTNGVTQGVPDDLFKLTAFHLIECKGSGLWKHEKLFRAYKTI